MEEKLKELSELVAAVKADVAEFRKTQKEKFAQIEAEGDVRSDTQTKLEKLGAKLDAMCAEKDALESKLQEQIDQMKTAVKRHSEGGETKVAGKPYKSFGEQLVDIVNAADPSKQTSPRLHEVKAAAGLSEGIGADGGFLVQTDFSNELIKRAYTLGAVMSRVAKIPVSANSNGTKIPAVNETSRKDGSRYGGVLAYWADEAGAKTPSQPSFRLMELSLKKLVGLVPATDELLQDAGALEAFIMMALPEELNFKAENSVIRGTGGGQPQGILNSGAVIAVPREAGQAALTVIAENIFNMYARMWARSLPNAVWFINQDVQPQLFQMFLQAGTGGVPVYLPPGGLSASPYGTLMGRPVVPIEYCSTLGTPGDILFLDLSQYLMIDKGGIQSASSIHVYFTTDQQVFRFVYRVDGQPLWNAPLTPFQGTTTLSPYISLAAAV